MKDKRIIAANRVGKTWVTVDKAMSEEKRIYDLWIEFLKAESALYDDEVDDESE